MSSKNRALFFQLLLFVTLAIANFGCGGSSSAVMPPPPPAISVLVSPTTAVVQAGATVQLMGTVSNATSSSDVTWTLSCSAAQCGAITPVTTPSGTHTTYAAPATLPSNVTVTDTSVADKSKSSSATLIPVGYIPS